MKKEKMNQSIDTMVQNIHDILGDNMVCIYLHGSVAMNDFKLGWSDIDILCLTKQVLTTYEAEKLVNLRENLLKIEKNNPYFRSFEGAILSVEEFKKRQNAKAKVVYWGTSGERITDQYVFDVFSQYELIKYGKLIWGTDIRNELMLPTSKELNQGVLEHYQSIRNYANRTGESLYSCGWLLDIARCIYTLRYHDVISKTTAGEWALKENLCPEKEQMICTLKIRKNPLEYKHQKKVKQWLNSLGTSVQLFADVLYVELKNENLV